MNIFEFMGFMSCKDGDELFNKVKTILGRYGITAYNEDGSVKDLYAVLCKVAEVINKEK